MTEAKRIQAWEQRLSIMKQQRKELEPHWVQIASLMMPQDYARKNFIKSFAKVKQNWFRVYEPMGRLALRTLASGMHGGLTSPSRPWFVLGMADDNLMDIQEVQTWLYECQTRLANTFNRSNFYDQIHRLYSELAAFGPAVIMVEEDPETTIRCETLNIGDYWLGSTSQKGYIDTLYRVINFNAMQLMDRWADSAPQEVKKDLESNSALEAKYKVLHVLEPRKDYDPTSKHALKRPYLSAYILIEGPGAKTLLEESGYYEQPFIAARWNADYSDVYGAGPASDALPDVKTAQGMRRDTYTAMQKELNPPLNITNTINQQIKTGPGETNFIGNYNNAPTITPLYQVRANFEGAEHSIAVLKENIKAALFYDLFLLLSNTDKNMTATEVNERNAEKMLLLGPTLERLRSELFNPLIQRVFAIMWRQKLIPEPPEVIAGQPMKVEFVGILAVAQKAAVISGIERISQYVVSMAQAFPEILDKFNYDMAADEMERLLSISPDIIRSADEVAALRQARAEQQQAMMQQQQQMQTMQMGIQGMQGMATAVKDAAAAGIPVADNLQAAMGGENVN